MARLSRLSRPARSRTHLPQARLRCPRAHPSWFAQRTVAVTESPTTIVESAPTHQRVKRRHRRGHGETAPPCSGLTTSTPPQHQNRVWLLAAALPCGSSSGAARPPGSLTHRRRWTRPRRRFPSSRCGTSPLAAGRPARRCGRRSSRAGLGNVQSRRGRSRVPGSRWEGRQLASGPDGRHRPDRGEAHG